MSFPGILVLESFCMAILWDLQLAPHLPSGMSEKCSLPPNKLRGRGSSSFSGLLTKSIKVRGSCLYHCGGFEFLLSIQKLCILHKQEINALILFILIWALKGNLSNHHLFVKTQTHIQYLFGPVNGNNCMCPLVLTKCLGMEQTCMIH